jgi:3-oxoacyl-[acyl-carrier protein] reductase
MKKVYFITGGTTELGVETLKNLLESETSSENSSNSSHFIMHGFSNSAAADELQKLHPNAAVDFVSADLSSDAEIDKLLDYLDALITPVTHWVHICAPKLLHLSKFAEVEVADFDMNMRIQVRSALVIAQFIVTQMSKKKYGRIVFVLSSCIYGGAKNT